MTSRSSSTEGLDFILSVSMMIKPTSSSAADKSCFQCLARLGMSFNICIKPGSRHCDGERKRSRKQSMCGRPAVYKCWRQDLIGPFASMCPACLRGFDTAGQDGLRSETSKQGCGFPWPLDCTECVSPWIVRSRHLLLLLQTLPDEARSMRRRVPPISQLCRFGEAGVRRIIVFAAR